MFISCRLMLFTTVLSFALCDTLSAQQLRSKVEDLIADYAKNFESLKVYAVQYRVTEQQEPGTFFGGGRQGKLSEIDAFQVVDREQRFERFDLHLHTMLANGETAGGNTRLLKRKDDWYFGHGVGDDYSVVSSEDGIPMPLQDYYGWHPFLLPFTSPGSIKLDRMSKIDSIFTLFNVERIAGIAEVGGKLRVSFLTTDESMVRFVIFDLVSGMPEHFEYLLNREKLSKELGRAEMDFVSPSKTVQPFCVTSTKWAKNADNVWLPIHVETTARMGPKGQGDFDGVVFQLKWLDPKLIRREVFSPDDVLHPFEDRNSQINLLFNIEDAAQFEN